MVILVTAIGSMSALCVINQLHKAGHIVIGCDVYPKEWHYESSLCDVFKQAPFAIHNNEYVDFILSLALDNNVDYIFPLTDIEIDVLNAHRNIFDKYAIKLCMPSADTLSISRNKYKLYQCFCDDENVPSIKTVIGADELSTMSYPCVAKPYDGRSSEGLFILNKESDLCLIDNIQKYIIQEMISGSIYTVDYVRNPISKQCFCVPRKELLRTKNGAGISIQLMNDDVLINLVKYIGEKLDVCGVVNMEFISTNGLFYLIDVNPRFSAGIAFSCSTGYDFVIAHLDCFVGKPIQNRIYFTDKIMTKYYVES